MPYREWEVERVRWNIGEVAKMIGRPTSAIRFWEGEFHWVKGKRDKGNKRYYNQEMIFAIKQVDSLLKDLGMTIEGVRKAHEWGQMEELLEIAEKRIDL